MNIDLTSSNIANILIIGVGITYLFLLLFFPENLIIFSRFDGYILSLLLGFTLQPVMRLTKNKFYINETTSVICCAKMMLMKYHINEEKSALLARPVYDLFLRESSSSEYLTKRIHDLDLQSRFIYSLSRLFLIASIMLIIAIVLKFVLIVAGIKYAERILYFIPNVNGDKLSYLTFLFIVFLFIISGLFFFIYRKFGASTKSTLIRLRNLEKMAIINNEIFFETISSLIIENEEILDKVLFEKYDEIPDAIIQP